MKETAQKLTPFISPNLRLDIVASVWEEYRDEAKLANELGCNPALVRQWLKEGKAPGDEHMCQILFLGLQCSSRVREILQVEVLGQIDSLFADLDICHQEQPDRDFGEILDLLDEKSRQIVWYLWWNRHAEIGEMVKLTKAYSDMDILLRIKGVINPAAQDVLGRELVRFEDSRIDTVTGEKVMFSWWLEDESLSATRRQPLVDVFEDNGHIAIIAQLPAPMDLAREAQVENKDGVLRIRVGKVRG